MELTHLNKDNQPVMVDVGDKRVTRRTATAQAAVLFPPGLLDRLERTADGEQRSPKGPITQTAILAGIAAAKKTSELIPLCHLIPLDNCRVEIRTQGADRLLIQCIARATHKTGVEMEALTGAAIAALTVYDMCKALSHRIVIENIRLIEKTGGKSDVHDDAH